MHVSLHRYWTFKHLEKSLNIFKHAIAQTIFASWATFQDIAPPPRKPRHPGDPRSLEPGYKVWCTRGCFQIDLGSVALTSRWVSWDWLFSALPMWYTWCYFDVTLCFPTFETLRRFFWNSRIPSPIFDWSDDQFVFSTIDGNQFNLYHHLISWIGFCGLSVAAATGSSSGFRSKFAWTCVRCCSIEPQAGKVWITFGWCPKGLKTHPTRLSLRCCDVRWDFYDCCFTGHQCLGVGALSQLQLERCCIKETMAYLWKTRAKTKTLWFSCNWDMWTFHLSWEYQFSCCLGESIAACHHVSCSARFLRCLFAMVFTPMARAWRQCMDQRHRQEESWRQFTRILAARPSWYPGRWYNLFVSFDELRGS